MGKVCLGSIDDIVDGQAKGLDPTHSGTDSVFVVRKDEEVYAYVDICPHYGTTSLPWKRHQYLDGSSNYIVCSAHGALFDIKSGKCIQGACMGQSLKKLKIEILPNNEIWADLTAEEC